MQIINSIPPIFILRKLHQIDQISLKNTPSFPPKKEKKTIILLTHMGMPTMSLFSCTFNFLLLSVLWEETCCKIVKHHFMSLLFISGMGLFINWLIFVITDCHNIIIKLDAIIRIICNQFSTYSYKFVSNVVIVYVFPIYCCCK